MVGDWMGLIDAVLIHSIILLSYIRGKNDQNTKKVDGD